MKTIKVLILSLLVFAGGKLMGQNVRIHNNTGNTITVTLNFTIAGLSGYSAPPGSTSSYIPVLGTYTGGSISFTDNTCSPSQPFFFVFPSVWPFSTGTILCDGITPISFATVVDVTNTYYDLHIY